MINEQTSTKGTQPPFVPRTIHRLAVPIILGSRGGLAASGLGWLLIVRLGWWLIMRP